MCGFTSPYFAGNQYFTSWHSALQNYWAHSYSMKSWVYLCAPTYLNFNIVCVYFVILRHNNVYWTTSPSLYTVDFACFIDWYSPCVVVFVQVLQARSSCEQPIVIRVLKIISVMQLIFSCWVLYVPQKLDSVSPGWRTAWQSCPYGSAANIAGRHQVVGLLLAIINIFLFVFIND